MDNQTRIGGFNILPPGVKNLLIINVLAFLATIVFQSTKVCNLETLLGLHYIAAPAFKPWQFITYMFMHGNLSHLFFNMFALWMFGAAVENQWGTKRFLIFYFITGIGAALVHYLVTYLQIHPMLALLNQFLDAPSIETFRYLSEHNTNPAFKSMLDNNLIYLQQNPGSLNELVNITANAKDTFLNQFNIIGASGAVYGILLAFGMLFPNNYIYIYFVLPVKAKWMVLGYGILELLTGISSSDGIAHFAHLGGMIFGIILILLWRRTDRRNNSNTYYYNYQDPNENNNLFQRFKDRKNARQKDKYYVSTESGRPLSDEEYNAQKVAEQKHLDEILDKVSQKGYDALSKEEKDFLFKYSQK